MSDDKKNTEPQKLAEEDLDQVAGGIAAPVEGKMHILPYKPGQIY